MTAEQPEKTVSVTPPQVSPQQTQIWWQWTQAQIAHERSEIEGELKYEIEVLRDAVGEALGEKCHDVREDLRREIDSLGASWNRPKANSMRRLNSTQREACA